MIKAYWTRIVLFALICGAAAFLGSLYIPKKYQADVEVMVDQTAPDQTSMAMTNQDVSVQDFLAFARPRNIATQVEQLQSLGVLTAAAEKVAAKNPNFTDPTKDPNSELNPINLQHALSVSADPTSDIIDYDVRMSDPNLAQQTAQEIYNAFVDQNSENSKDLAIRAIASLQSQTATIDKELKGIDQKVTKAKTETGLADPANQINAEITGLANLKQQRDQAAIEAAGAQKTVAVLSDELSKTPKNIDQGTTTTTNPIWEKLETDLISAQADRAALVTQYMPDNELVKSADDRIKLIKTQLAGQKHDIPAQSINGLSQSYVALESQLATAKAAADASTQKLSVAQAQVDEREKYMQTLPPVEAQLASLARQQEALEKIYLGYQDSLKTLEAAKEGRTSPTQEISPSTAFPDAVSPKPLVNGLLGAVVGLILAVVSMLFTESKRQPVRSLAQLNGLAYAPVYRLIPELREPYRGMQKAPPEPFESLLLNYLKSDRRPYRVAVVGITKDAGASMTALNLAITGSRHAARVVFVECDAKGALARLGHKDPKAGEPFELGDRIRAVAASSVLGAQDHHAGIVSEIRAVEGDLTVIDLEPTTRSAEYAFLAPHVDEVILLVRAGKTRSVEFLQAQQALRDAGCRRVTVVFSRSSDFSVVVDGADSGGSQAAIPAWMQTEPTEESRQPVRPARASVAPIPVVEEEPVMAPYVSREPEPAPIEASPEPFAGPEPFAKPAPAEAEAAPEAPMQSAPQDDLEPTESTASNGTHEVEVPLRRTRSAPAVSIEDFGGIVRAKQPEAPKPEPATRSRRGDFDTSEIDS